MVDHYWRGILPQTSHFFDVPLVWIILTNLITNHPGLFYANSFNNQDF